MRFIYVIPVYNEETQVEHLVERLGPFLRAHPQSVVWIVDNGSKDKTWSKILELKDSYKGLVNGLRVLEKGQGRAFREAMKELDRAGLDPEARVVFSAADLPFGLSDVECILRHGLTEDLVIGSKAHPESLAQRGLARELMSMFYRWLRFGLLGMQARDPQGSLLFKAKWLHLFGHCDAVDFFYTTQLVYWMEHEGASVVEIPVKTQQDFRPSRVRPLRDGWRVFRQIFHFAWTNGRVKAKTQHRLLSA